MNLHIIKCQAVHL